MALQLGEEAPDFEADTTEGRIKFHDWIGDSWAVLFSHPKDFTPICTTELGYMAKIKPDFDARNVKIIGLSVDALNNHEQGRPPTTRSSATATTTSQSSTACCRPTPPATPRAARPPTIRRSATSS
jgi:alkyl hydroperoxide reductase subunit AhpC